MATRHTNDGLYKRCDCPQRNWLKCAHPWHFDFYKGKKYRFSLDKIARARELDLPRTKGAAEALRDLIRSEIRGGTFRDPNHPTEPLPADARLTFSDVADQYLKRHVRTPLRRESATYLIERHIDVLKRVQIPAAHGQAMRLGEKVFADITKSDVEAGRDYQREQARNAVTAREEWKREKAERAARAEAMDRPMPRIVPGVKGGEVGINRLLARLRHLFTWAIGEGHID